MASHRYARALIDLPAFGNLALARRCAGSSAVYAVVKADAYGHGADGEHCGGCGARRMALRSRPG